MTETPKDDAVFVHSLLAVHRFQRTGVLEVRAEGVSTLVYVQKGVPVFAEQGSLGETLGRVLVRQGVLTQEQYSAVIEGMTQSVFGSEQLRFGEVAVTLGYLSLQQVNDALAEQVRQKVVRCMQWSAPACEFKPVAEALDEVARYPSPVEPLLLEGLREFFDEQRVRPLWEESAAEFAAPADTADAIVARFKLGRAERLLVESIDGSRTVAEVIGSGQLEEIEAARLVSALLLTEALVTCATSDEAQAQAQAARSLVRVPGGRKVAVSGPDQDAGSPSEIPDAIARALVVPSVAPPNDPASGDEASASAPAQAPTSTDAPDSQAKSTSQRPFSIPVPSDVKYSRLRAEQLFQSGRAHLWQGHWAKAFAELDKAAKLYPEAIEYELHAAWAEFRTLDDPEEISDQKEKLGELALRAVRQDRNMAFSHYVYAQLYLMADNEKAAHRSFLIAFKLDRENKDAERHYRVLDRRLRGREEKH